MKHWIIILLVLIVGGCKEEPKKSEPILEVESDEDGFYSQLKKSEKERSIHKGLGIIHFEKDEHDFGVVQEGDIVVYRFEYTNIGKGPIVIEDVQSKCGCTSPEWSEGDVMPNEKGYIDVALNTKRMSGDQSKAVVVYTNGTPYKSAIVVRALVKQ